MKLIFLDIDGVLNDHYWNVEAMSGQIQPNKVARLNHVLRDTGACIVLSSAWRYLIHREEMNLRGFEWLLRSHGVIADRLVGYTEMDKEGYTRGNQIANYLRMSSYDCYVVVDDLDLGITEAGHPFVQTNGKIGLIDEDVSKLLAILGSK